MCIAGYCLHFSFGYFFLLSIPYLRCSCFPNRCSNTSARHRKLSGKSSSACNQRGSVNQVPLHACIGGSVSWINQTCMHVHNFITSRIDNIHTSQQLISKTLIVLQVDTLIAQSWCMNTATSLWTTWWHDSITRPVTVACQEHVTIMNKVQSRIL